MAWVAAPGADYQRAAREEVELGVQSVDQLTQIAAAADSERRLAREAHWPTLVLAARVAEKSGLISVRGIYSHLACADDPGHPSVRYQLDAFEAAYAQALAAGLQPDVRHIANSAATLTLPETHLDMVRAGTAIYGLNPWSPDQRVGHPALRPAMTVIGRVTSVKLAPGGVGVSYGHTYTTRGETTLVVIPLGYGDGISRAASNNGEVLIGAARYPIVGRVCMDQLTVDVGSATASVGEEAVLFGPGDSGEPTAEEWAARIGTIHYEVVTGIGGRVKRIYRSSNCPVSRRTPPAKSIGTTNGARTPPGT